MSVFQNLKNRSSRIRYCFRVGKSKPDSSGYMKYAPEYKFNGEKVLNVGCGSAFYRSRNVVNLDMFPGDGINVVCDLSKGDLPFETGHFDFILANHILEHVPNWWDCFKELSRILKVGGILEIWLPGDGGSSQLGYRDHINVINYCSFTGTRGTVRNKTNSWEGDANKHSGHATDMELSKPIAMRLPNWWWIFLLPRPVMNFMLEHLRNVAVESGFFYKKLPPITKGET